jgi:succinoglycan biosynthesis transport protein ExoP
VDPATEAPANEQIFSFDLGQYIGALRKYVWAVLALVAIAIAAAVLYTSHQKKVYEAKASILIESRLPDLLGQGEDILTASAAGGVGIEHYKQQLQVLSSYMLVQKTVEENQLYLKLLSDQEREGRKLDDQVDIATRRLQQLLTAQYPNQDRIMYVLIRNEDPRLAAEIANQHVGTYVAYTKNLLSLDTTQASTALSAEFMKAEEDLRKADEALHDFQKENELLAVSLEDRQSLVSANISSFTARANEARSKGIELGTRLERMKRLPADDFLDSPILMMSDSSSFDALRAEYYTERNAFVQLEKEVGPKSFEFQKQKAKVDDLYAALQSEAKRIVGGVNERYEATLAAERALEGEIAKYKKDALDLGPKIVQYNKLERNKKSIEDRYNILRGRLSTSELTGNMNKTVQTSYAKPLDKALVPTKPVSPNVRVNIMTAGSMALVVGLGLVILLVFLDRSIKNAADAQNAAGVPVLGVIPMLDASDMPDDHARDLYVHQHPTSAVAECCRSLRTNILFSAADRKLKTIIVSSPNPREGKTTIVMYLGTTMAQSGQRVLMIDTDLRRPRLHISTGVPRQHGISDLILGSQNYDEVIKATDVPNLWVLPCGPLPPNPAELLMTKRFEAVLAELATRFDRIILDSPPLMLSDAVVLSKATDGVILVARSRKTHRDELRHAAKQIRDVGGTIFGVIVNELDDGDRGYYSYGYGYSYGSDADAPAKAS